jgi:hypothetical protein
LKPEWWGAPLVQVDNCWGKKPEIRIIIMIIIIIIIIII